MSSAAGGEPARIAVTSDVDRQRQAFAWRFVTPLYVTATLNPINSSLIATALVPIAHALRVPVGQTAILVSALYLASSVAQPAAGKLAEQFGPRRVLLAGIVLVLAGGTLGGAGQAIPVVAMARALIGIGTSAGYPAAMVIIRRRAIAFGLSEPPGRVLGGLSVAGTVTVAIGPPIGGVLVDAFGWRSTFLLNIPITAIALLLTIAWVPKDQPLKRSSLREIAAGVDAGGIALFGGVMGALLTFLLSLPRPQWAALGVTIALCVVLVVWELRASTPFIDMRLLVSNLALTRTYVRNALLLLSFYVLFYGLTQWLEAAHGLSPRQAGLLLLPMGLLAALLSQPISARNLVRGPLVVGAASMVAASGAVALLTAHTPVVVIIGVTLLFAITLGTAFVGNQTALYLQAPAELVGVAAGLSRTLGYVGSIASSTITGIVFSHNVTDSGMQMVGRVLVAASVAMLVLTVFDRSLKTPKAGRASRGKGESRSNIDSLNTPPSS